MKLLLTSSLARGAASRRLHLFRRGRALAGALVATAAFAQSGTLVGTVSNQATGDLLPGATVAIEGTNVSGATERGGAYRLTVPAGDHTLVVNFAGLDGARVAVSVRAGATAVKDVQLTSGIYRLEAFAVTGVREGNAQAIQLQRQAANPKTVAATDTFGNPAANPGELIQRLPGISTDVVGSEVRTLFIRGMGPGFSSLLVDGDRMASSTGTSASRDYQIEQLGTGNVESIELIKAPTPDQDANAVAGYVNLVTRRAFDLPGRRITLTGGSLWRQRSFGGSPFQDRPDDLDLVGLSYSDVFGVLGGKNNLGLAFNVNRRVSATTQDEAGPAGVLYTAISRVYLNPTSTNPLTRIFGTGDFGYPAKAHNVGLSADYKLSSDAFVFLKFSLNTNEQYQEYYRPAFGNPAATAANFTADSTYDHSFLIAHAASIGISESSIFTKKSANFALSGGGETKLFDGTATLALRGSYSHANINYPAWIRTQARTTGIGFEIDRRGQDPWYPIFRQTGGPSITEAASYNMSTMTRQAYKAPNDLYGLRADFTKRFAAAIPLTLKAGAKIDDDNREQLTDYTASTWTGADGLANSTDDALTPYATVRYSQADGRYGPFPFMTVPGSGRTGDPVNAPAGYWRQTAADAYNSFATSNASDAKFRETITAAYVQGSVRFGSLRVLGGLRFEETKTEGTGWVRNTTATWGGNSVGGASLVPATVEANTARAQRSFVRRNTSTGQYRDVFPGLHFVYEPRDGLLFRASYNRAISRPAVASLIPTITENTDTNTVTVGNPELKPYHTNNFELSAEKYFEPVGLFSISAFLKEISDYSRSSSTAIGAEGLDGGGLYAGYTLTTTRNVGDARIRGIELGYQQQFSFLPGALRGLGAFANYTYLQAEGTFGAAVTTTKLSNLAPRSGNAGVNFRYRGLDARILGNWTDQKYFTTNGGVDVYNEERLTLDLKLQYSITRRYEVFLDINNLTDEPSRAWVTLNGLHFFKGNQGVAFTAGVRGRF